MNKKRWLLALSTFVLLPALMGCPSSVRVSESQKAALERVQTRVMYEPKNDIEAKIYNRRQRIADDPTTILWCTTAFSTPGSPLVTIPIIQKLVSGNKRPYPTHMAAKGSTDTTYYPELPGPDGMYGSSGEYRYGFTPTDDYLDFYNMETLCTTAPLVWQKEATTLAMQADPALLEAHKKARAALKLGQPELAGKILADAIANNQKGSK